MITHTDSLVRQVSHLNRYLFSSNGVNGKGVFLEHYMQNVHKVNGVRMCNLICMFDDLLPVIKVLHNFGFVYVPPMSNTCGRFHQIKDLTESPSMKHQWSISFVTSDSLLQECWIGSGARISIHKFMSYRHTKACSFYRLVAEVICGELMYINNFNRSKGNMFSFDSIAAIDHCITENKPEARVVNKIVDIDLFEFTEVEQYLNTFVRPKDDKEDDSAPFQTFSRIALETGYARCTEHLIRSVHFFLRVLEMRIENAIKIFEGELTAAGIKLYDVYNHSESTKDKHDDNEPV